MGSIENFYLHVVLLALANVNHWSTNRHVPVHAIRRRILSELTGILIKSHNKEPDGPDKVVNGKLVKKYLRELRKKGFADCKKGTWYISKDGIEEARRLKGNFPRYGSTFEFHDISENRGKEAVIGVFPLSGLFFSNKSNYLLSP